MWFSPHLAELIMSPFSAVSLPMCVWPSHRIQCSLLDYHCLCLFLGGGCLAQKGQWSDV